jgi:hypothetical protein
MMSARGLPKSHPLRAAHKKSSRNRGEVEASQKCGCFYCGAIFDAHQVTKWVFRDEPVAQQTAICPFCSVDSVIGDSSGVEITRKFLEKMHDAWFGRKA